MSDLDRVLSEAQRAREEAAAAARRAEELEAQAEAARERARQEAEERRRTWAQGVVDRYDAEIAQADQEIQEAEAHFHEVSFTDLSQAIPAYVAWGEATLRHYALQLRVAAAAPRLGYDASPPELAAPPLFSQALDAALAEAIGKRADAARAEINAELARLDGSGAGA